VLGIKERKRAPRRPWAAWGKEISALGAAGARGLEQVLLAQAGFLAAPKLVLGRSSAIPRSDRC